MAVTKAPSPLLGYNNNVRHKNRMFHVQTEDSGVKHPHIITHLFMDGGRILKSVKKSYAEHVGTDGMADVVRTMMKEQHKAMLIALRDGQFDYLVDVKAKPPAAAEPAAQARSPQQAQARPPSAPPLQPAGQARRAPSQRPPPPARPPSGGPAWEKEQRRSGGWGSSATRAAVVEEAPATTRTPSRELTLDIDALERAAKDAERASPMYPANDLPPPPQNLLRDKQVQG